MLKAVAAALILVAAGSSAASALTIRGTAQVADSDILTMDGYGIYLFGMESVEERQDCAIDGQAWQCWAAAVRELQTIVSEGEVVCETITEPTRTRQVIAWCTVNGEDIAERFVRAGYGLPIGAETDSYFDDMLEAADAKRGLWQGAFEPPAQWRARNSVFVDRPPFRPVNPLPDLPPPILPEGR